MVLLAALFGLVVVTGAGAEDDDGGTVQVDLRVWQRVSDPTEVLLSARASGGEWRVLPEELPLEETNKRGTYRYSDRTVAVLVGDGTAYVDVRVWQSVCDPLRVYLSARPTRGKWGATERLPMGEKGYYYRHSDRTVEVLTPVPLDKDVVTLLAWKDTQAGMSALNWSHGRAVSSWAGVTVAGTPERVTKLELPNGGLTGELSGLVGELTGLRELRLDGNALTGRIPSKVALLTRLTHLYLSGNAFTGCVPQSSRAVANNDLATLGLPDCGAPLTVDFSPRTERTLTAGTYQYSLFGAEWGVPLILDVPEGLAVDADSVMVDAMFPPAHGALVLADPGSDGRSRIAIDDELGVVYGPWVHPDARPGLATLFDRLAESVWIDRECAIATLGQCSEDRQ